MDLPNTTLPGGIEPLYDMQVAARLIPMPYVNLKQWLCTHKDQYPQRYRRGPRRGRIRLLSASEILAIRAQTIWFGTRNPRR